MPQRISVENMENMQKVLNLEVGGLIGIGATQSISIITLEKDQFSPGDDIVVNIDCDNSKCRKPVKEFKLKV